MRPRRAKPLPVSDVVYTFGWQDDAEVQAYLDAARVSGEMRETWRQAQHAIEKRHAAYADGR